MIRHKTLFSLIAVGSLSLPTMVAASPVSITNSGFQEPVVPTDGNANDEDFLNTADPPVSPNGWTYSFAANTPSTPAWGVQRPDPDSNYTRDVSGGETAPFTAGGFDGDQIGFININNTGTIAYADSDVVGTLQAGTYTLTVAVGGRNVNNWADIDYSVGLVGSTSGLLGSSSVTLDPGNAANNSASSSFTTTAYNVVDLTFVLEVPTDGGVLGEDYFVRIIAENTGERGGVTQATFSQANFDNARLDFQPIPEPGSIALMGLGGLLVARRRRH